MAEYRIADKANPHFKNICSQISIICRSDKISVIDGWQIVKEMPHVIDALCMYKVGDVIGKEGTTASIFARLHIVVNCLEELYEVKNKIYSTLSVRNNLDENLVIYC